GPGRGPVVEQRAGLASGWIAGLQKADPDFAPFSPGEHLANLAPATGRQSGRCDQFVGRLSSFSKFLHDEAGAPVRSDLQRHGLSLTPKRRSALGTFGQREGDHRITSIEVAGLDAHREFLFRGGTGGHQGEQANRRAENVLHAVCLRRWAWIVKFAGTRQGRGPGSALADHGECTPFFRSRNPEPRTRNDPPTPSPQPADSKVCPRKGSQAYACLL